MNSEPELLQAPWSSAQVDALNYFQRRGDFHEFTCPEHHDGADRTLLATKDGWLCPHCDYRQNWAHSMMVTQPPLEHGYILPCDVMLPPATVIRKGCHLGTLMTGLNVRIGRTPGDNSFGNPAESVRAYQAGEDIPITVKAADYNYEGRLAGVALKRSGAVRYIVEDASRRLFIHNHFQIGVAEGWLPDSS
jgi:hypothetical protein